jgi:hypothetical protein
MVSLVPFPISLSTLGLFISHGTSGTTATFTEAHELKGGLQGNSGIKLDLIKIASPSRKYMHLESREIVFLCFQRSRYSSLRHDQMLFEGGKYSSWVRSLLKLSK